MKYLHWIRLAAPAVLLAAGIGCGPSPETVAALQLAAEVKARAAAESQAKTALNAQFAKGVAAILSDDINGFKAVLDSTTRQDAPKCNLTWVALRLLVGRGGFGPEDFRIDAITLNQEMTLAMVVFSHREKGEWKRNPRPQVWTREGNEWRWML